MTENRDAYSATAIVEYERLQVEARAEARRLTTAFVVAVAAVAAIAATIVAALSGIGVFLLETQEAGNQGLPPPSFRQSIPWGWVWVLSLLAVAGLISWIKHQVQKGLVAGGGVAIARQLGGRPADLNSLDPAERRFVNVVQEIAIAARIPAPEVWVLVSEHGVNVFNAGWTHETTVIGVTRGALEHLTRDELQAVAAQSMAHVFHGDARLNMRLMAMVSGIAGIAIVGEDLLDTARRMAERGQRGFMGMYVVGGLIKGSGWIGTYAASLIQRSVARRDELTADATAIELTRDAEPLVRAYRRIGGSRYKGRIRHHARRRFNHLFLTDTRGKVAGSIHPDLRERILRIDPDWTGKMLESQRHDKDVAVSDGIAVNPSVADRFAPVAEPGTTPSRDQELSPIPGLGAVMLPLVDSGIGSNEAVAGGFPGIQVDFAPGAPIPEPVAGMAGAAALLGAATLFDRRVEKAAQVPRGARAILLGVVLESQGRLSPEAARTALQCHGEVEFGLIQILELLQEPLVEAIERDRALLVLSTGGRAGKGEPEHVEPFYRSLVELVGKPERAGGLDDWMLRELVLDAADPRPSGVGNASLDDRRKDYGVLVTLMAGLGGSDPSIAASVAGHVAGVGALHLIGMRSLKVRDLHKALDLLAALPEDDRRRARAGLAACASADGSISEPEVTLLKLTSGRFDLDWDPSLVKGDDLGPLGATTGVPSPDLSRA